MVDVPPTFSRLITVGWDELAVPAAQLKVQPWNVTDATVFLITMVALFVTVNVTLEMVTALPETVAHAGLPVRLMFVLADSATAVGLE
jgi:hypothetical protein